MAKRKEFSILKWIVFPLNSVVLAGAIAWFNLRVFGLDDGLPYTVIVGLIGMFSIIINKYTESDNRALARAAFVFEIVLTVALIGNAAWSISVQREMSVARMGETSQKETIGEISKLKGSKTQREALKKVDAQKSASSVFAKYENTLFWIMVGELALYGLSAFTLFALAKLMDDPAPAKAPDFAQNRPESLFPEELDVDYGPGPKRSASLRQPPNSPGIYVHSTQKTTPVATGGREKAAEALRDHLRVISSGLPNRSFKVDLRKLEEGGGVWIRLYESREGKEKMIAKTKQSDKILTATIRPDFRERLIDELIHQGFPIGGG